MREPHQYVCKDGKQHCVAWYENGKRLRKTFNDANKAEVFYQQKLLGAVDKQDLILEGVTTLRKYVIYVKSSARPGEEMDGAPSPKRKTSRRVGSSSKAATRRTDTKK